MKSTNSIDMITELVDRHNICDDLGASMDYESLLHAYNYYRYDIYSYLNFFEESGITVDRGYIACLFQGFEALEKSNNYEALAEYRIANIHSLFDHIENTKGGNNE